MSSNNNDKDMLNLKLDDLTEKQFKFCLEYCKDFNGTQAAIRAGYSKNTAMEQASRLLSNVKVSGQLDLLLNRVKKNTIMDIQEIQERLTAIARGEVDEDVVVTVNTGNFKSKAQIVKKGMAGKEQVKALELLGKANALFKENVKQDVSVTSRFEEFNNFMGAIKNGNLQKK